MTRRSWIGAAVLGVLLVAVIAGALYLMRPRPATSPLPTVQIGYLAATINLPFFVALEEGYFSAEGVAVEPVRFESTADLFSAVAAGRLDVTAIGGIAALYPIELQQPGLVKIFWLNANAGERYTDAFIVRTGSDIRTYADLKGKKLGIFPGTTSEMGARLILAHYNLKPGRDVEVVQIPPQLQLQALESGRVDALITLEPTGTLAIEQGVGTLVQGGPQMKHVLEPLPGGAAVLRTSWVTANREVAAAIKRAIDKAIDRVEAAPDVAKRTLSKYTGIPEGTALATRICLYWKLETADRQAVQEYANILQREGILAGTVDTSQMFLDPGILSSQGR